MHTFYKNFTNLPYERYPFGYNQRGGYPANKLKQKNKFIQNPLQGELYNVHIQKNIYKTEGTD